MDSTNITSIREALLDIRSRIDGVLTQITPPEESAGGWKNPALEFGNALLSILEQSTQKKGEHSHKTGDKITIHNADPGDIPMDCIDAYNDGKRGLYLFHFAIPNMEFDAAEAAGRGEDYGSNDYALSNVRAWLKSGLVDWWKRTHVFDAPPSYADKPGFLHGFSSATMGRIVPFDDGDVFRLLSYDEVTGGIPYLQTEEGKKLLRKTDKGGKPVWWWLRSPYPYSTSYVRNVYADGDSGYGAGAYGRGGGVAAACLIQ